MSANSPGVLAQFPALVLEQLAAVPKAEPGARQPQLQVQPLPCRLSYCMAQVHVHLLACVGLLPYSLSTHMTLAAVLCATA